MGLKRINRVLSFVFAISVLAVARSNAAPEITHQSITDFLSNKTEPIQITTSKEFTTLTTDRDVGRLMSNKKFAVPFHYTVMAKVESKSLRLFAGDNGKVILNWEDHPTELRYIDPSGHETNLPGHGTIPTNQWVEINWVVSETFTSLEVNHRSVLRTAGDFRGQSMAVGISPAFGGTIDIKSISVSGVWGRASADAFTPDAIPSVQGNPPQIATASTTAPGLSPTAAAPTAATPVAATASYQPPDLSAVLFNIHEVKLPQDQRQGVANLLANYVRDQLKMEKTGDAALASRVLGIALRIDPENRNAIVLNALLQHGNPPSHAGQPTTKPADLPTQILPIAAACTKSESGEDRALAAYLYGLVLSVDPTNEEAIYQTELLRQRGVIARWEWAGGSSNSGHPIADGETKSFARRQSTIKGMTVLMDSNGRMVGNLSEDIVTVMPGKPLPEGARFMRDVGDEMKVALQEAVRAVRVRYPRWEDADVQISFDDKFSKMDGPSGGAAFTVLLLSALEGFDIDPNIALTGDITVDGKLRRIGGVDPKLRGATHDGMTCAIIPEENKNRIDDYLVMNGPAALWNIQIFSAVTVDDAVRILRTDREANVSEAIRTFSEVQEACKKSGVAALSDPIIHGKLARIIEMMPNHVSAQYLLLIAAHRQPTRLTLAGSVSQTFAAVVPLRESLFGNNVPNRTSFPETAAVEVRNQLRDLKHICDPNASRLLDSMFDFLDAASHADSPSGIQRLNTRRLAILNELDRLEAKRDNYEELVRDGL